VRAVAEVNTPEEFENIIINGKTRLGDVANVVFSAASSSSGLRSDGKAGIGIGIVRQAQSNSIQISEGVQAAVDQLKEISARRRQHHHSSERIRLHRRRRPRSRDRADHRRHHRYWHHLPVPARLARHSSCPRSPCPSR
jgi:hypothetical protein